MACNITLGNTGASECPIEMGIIKSVINFPFGATPEYTGNTTALLNTFIETAIHAAAASRGYFYPTAIDIEDNVEDPVFEDTSIGFSMFVRDGSVGFTHMYKQDLNLLPKLRTANGLNLKSYLVDDKGQVFGLSGSTGYIPVPMMVTTVNGNFKGGDATAKMKTIYRFVNNNDYHELKYMGTTSIPESLLTGLSDVTLTNVGTASSPVIKLWIDSVDVTSRYATLLTDKTAWLVKGAAPTAASVTYDSAAIGFKTFGTTTTTADVITLVAPSSLLALSVPVKYIECSPLTL